MATSQGSLGRVVPAPPRESLAQPRTLTALAWRRFRRHKMAMVGLIMLIVMIVYIVGGSLVYSEAYANFNDTSIRVQAPSAEHLFGTDEIGRDILARTIYGGQISLIIGFLSVLLSITVGTAIGVIAGYYGGVADSVLMRFTEAVLSLPTLLLLLVMAKFFGGRLPNVEVFGRDFSGSVIVIILIIGFTSWTVLARLVRSSFLTLKEQDFVLAARALGATNVQIMIRHILPNAVAPILVAATLGMANAILQEAYISFLGLGVQAPTATWGSMMQGATGAITRGQWWLWFFPGLLIVLTVLSINFLGDGLRDALDPRSQKG
ncbi:MAG: ABC transporter permease [Chloroflexota bacterium]|nr:ABC transporter permease [Chloroflexota bacterium]